jgi:hypothetical protein
MMIKKGNNLITKLEILFSKFWLKQKGMICILHLKVSKYQKHLFLQLHYQKKERNIWQNSALAS